MPSFNKRGAMPRLANKARGVAETPDTEGGGFNAPKVLRLSFHDCVRYTDGSGGCDGCLNWEGVGVWITDFKKRRLPDVNATNNNGLRHSVEVLEALYTLPDFPPNTPVLAASLRDSGKSRADLWALAGIVAVEYGVEANNRKCRGEQFLYSGGQCHQLQAGEYFARIMS